MKMKNENLLTCCTKQCDYMSGKNKLSLCAKSRLQIFRKLVQRGMKKRKTALYKQSFNY